MTTTTMQRIAVSAFPGAKEASSSTLGATLAAWAGNARRLVLDHVRAKRAMRRLEELDDRMLRDIGVSRSEIASAVYGRTSQEHRCHARF